MCYNNCDYFNRSKDTCSKIGDCVEEEHLKKGEYCYGEEDCPHEAEFCDYCEANELKQ